MRFLLISARKDLWRRCPHWSWTGYGEWLSGCPTVARVDDREDVRHGHQKTLWTGVLIRDRIEAHIR